jgi:hypothetical protein
MATSIFWVLVLLLSLTVQAKPENDDDLYSFVTVCYAYFEIIWRLAR